LIEFRFVLGSPQATKELSEFLLLFFKTLQSVGAILVERIVAARLQRLPIAKLTHGADSILPKAQAGAFPPFQPSGPEKDGQNHEPYWPTDPQGQEQNDDPYRLWVFPLVEFQKRGHRRSYVNVNNIYIGR
jgi:hypothetical protein